MRRHHEKRRNHPGNRRRHLGVPLNYPELGNQAAHGIGGPQVIGVAMQSAPASGDTYAAARDRHGPPDLRRSGRRDGEALRLPERPAAPIRKAVFASGSGSANLDFAFTVAGGGLRRQRGERLLEPPARPRLRAGAARRRRDRRERRRAGRRPRPARPGRPVRPQGRRHAGAHRDGPGRQHDGRTLARRPCAQTGACTRQAWPRGDPFRLIFVTSTNRDATSGNIDVYNRFVIGAAGSGHADIRAYRNGFRALASAGTSAGTMRRFMRILIPTWGGRGGRRTRRSTG